MRLVTFRSGGRMRLGVLRSDGSHIVEVSEPGDMLALIDAGERGLDKVREVAAKSGGHEHRVDEIELLPPLPQPRGNVIAIGRNYEKHAAETARIEGREYPALKANRTQVADCACRCTPSIHNQHGRELSGSSYSIAS